MTEISDELGKLQWVLEDSLARTAQRLAQTAKNLDLTHVNERDHLAKCFRATLDESATQHGFRLARQGERRCDFPDHFPRVGNVDEILVGSVSKPTWVELKCGSDPKWALSDCGWDAIKCALGLTLNVADAAYLVGGAPASVWESGVLGTELFAGGMWETSRLRTEYAAMFEAYEKRSDPTPRLIPASFATSAVGQPAPFRIGGISWELRLASVDSRLDADWYRWSRLT